MLPCFVIGIEAGKSANVVPTSSVRGKEVAGEDENLRNLK
jgi:hypothetical protein